MSDRWDRYDTDLGCLRQPLCPLPDGHAGRCVDRRGEVLPGGFADRGEETAA